MIGWKTFWEKNVTSKYGTYTYHIQETTQLFFVSTALPTLVKSSNSWVVITHAILYEETKKNTVVLYGD